jgi:hypothetical protein
MTIDKRGSAKTRGAENPESPDPGLEVDQRSGGSLPSLKPGEILGAGALAAVALEPLARVPALAGDGSFREPSGGALGVGFVRTNMESSASAQRFALMT